MGRRKWSSADSGVQQESSRLANVGSLGWTAQPVLLRQPLTTDNEPEMESSAKRKDALPRGVSPTH